MEENSFLNLLKDLIENNRDYTCSYSIDDPKYFWLDIDNDRITFYDGIISFNGEIVKHVNKKYINLIFKLLRLNQYHKDKLL